MDLFCYLCFVSFMMSCLSIAALWPPAGKELVSWLSCMCCFLCVIVTFPCVVLGQVWYLIVSIPDFCLLLNYIYHKLASIKNCLIFRMLSQKRRYSNQHNCYV